MNNTNVPEPQPVRLPADTAILGRWLTQKLSALSRGSYLAALLFFGLGIFTSLIHTVIFYSLAIFFYPFLNPLHAAWGLLPVFLLYPLLGRRKGDDKRRRRLGAIVPLVFAPPHCFELVIREIREARRLAAIDVSSCAAVIALVFSGGRAVSDLQLLEALPQIELEKVMNDLPLIPGVSLLIENPGVTCTEPLIEEIRRFVESA